MNRFLGTILLLFGVSAYAVAAPTDAVTQADLKVLLDRISKLEAENKAQAKRIEELENQDKQVEKWMAAQDIKTTEQNRKFELQTERLSQMAMARAPSDGATTTNESGRIWTTAQGFKYYLADKSAGIFEPLSESGLKITPYGYLVFEAVHNTHGTETDMYSDWVKPPSSSAYGNHTTTFSMQDSILGLQFQTPESYHGWSFIGRAEFDLIGDHANDYNFHWRHLYVDAQHESGWSFIFGQTWHLWKMVSPSDIDGAWLENTGHPYRRSPQVRITKRWDWEDSSLEVKVGVLKNGPGMGGDRDYDGTQDNSASAVPLFEAAAVYDHDTCWQDENDLGGKRWLIGIGGMYGQDRSCRVLARDEDYNPTVLGDAEDFDSSMGMIAAILPFWDFKLTGQFFAGQNLGGVQAGVGQSVGFDNYGYGRAVRTMGGFLDLSYQLTSDWSFAIGYGFDNPDDEDAKYAAQRTYNDRAYIDAFYQVTTNFKLGVEYARLSTKYYDDGTGYSDRFQFSAFYDF